MRIKEPACRKTAGFFVDLPAAAGAIIAMESASALPMSRFLFHDRDVSIGLVCNHFPAAGQAGQNSGLRPALGEKHEAMAFISLSSAPIGMIHNEAFYCCPI
jgi:hypothetical protein